MRHRNCLFALLVLCTTLLAGCASLAPGDPLQVTVAGIDPLPGEGLELRLLVRLRLQNPNDAAVDYDGIYLQLDVQDKTFATGVSDKGGTLPAFGESLISVPVSVSAMRMARQFTGMLDGTPVDKISYKLTGKLGGSLLATRRFETQGEFALSGVTAN
ncbi:MAG: LEA type 2 family protein [Gammaproteobacteria bacterium]